MEVFVLEDGVDDPHFRLFDLTYTTHQSQLRLRDNLLQKWRSIELEGDLNLNIQADDFENEANSSLPNIHGEDEQSMHTDEDEYDECDHNNEKSSENVHQIDRPKSATNECISGAGIRSTSFLSMAKSLPASPNGKIQAETRIKDTTVLAEQPLRLPHIGNALGSPWTQSSRDNDEHSRYSASKLRYTEDYALVVEPLDNRQVNQPIDVIDVDYEPIKHDDSLKEKGPDVEWSWDLHSLLNRSPEKSFFKKHYSKVLRKANKSNAQALHHKIEQRNTIKSNKADVETFDMGGNYTATNDSKTMHNNNTRPLTLATTSGTRPRELNTRSARTYISSGRGRRNAADFHQVGIIGPRLRKPASDETRRGKNASSATSDGIEADEHFDINEGITKFEPLQRFRKAVRTLQIVLRAIASTRKDQQRHEAKLLSFAQIQQENGVTTFDSYGLSFDPRTYKANKEVLLSYEARHILRTDPLERTPEQNHIALVSLNQTVEAFSEFPIKMQESLVKAGWLERFGSKRIIIRQGHLADNFYFILSGTAVVTILDKDPKTENSFSKTVAFLKKGHSFGELALMQDGGRRSATVTCQDDVELLALQREDFKDIFMHVEENQEPEHIQFLRKVDILNGWPIESLPYDDTKVCIFTYFRRGIVMCKDGSNSDWIYILKTGNCRVLKGLTLTKPNFPGLISDDEINANNNDETANSKNKQSLFITRSQTKSSIKSNRDTSENKKTVPNVKIKGPNGSYEDLPNKLKQRNRTYTFPSATKERSRRTPKLPPLVRHGVVKSQLTKEDERQAINERLEEEERHKALLERVFQTQHPAGQDERVGSAYTRTSTPQMQSNSTQQTPNKVYVELERLLPKNTFGLAQFAFGDMLNMTSVTLVSDGAECILVHKNFFLKQASEDYIKKLRRAVQPYPTDDALQQKLQDQTNWDAYKSLTVNNIVAHHKYMDMFSVT
ncbi:unnamed protein product [Owenia fusiformis]|uniref:Cyclic nucleotide-binding domain-containing protein n=1 Tax=Owenia fusiformis TaxID=6347 RepID=A0A8S4NAD3_OWEFU|nr:unnamed protein product [Owenia fusiformis]